MLHELLAELCIAWPRRWDEYMAVATWVHWVEPDESLPDNTSSYKMLFDRDFTHSVGRDDAYVGQFDP